ncbi:MAG: peptidase-C39 like family protein, partial [bacterium]
MIPITIRTQPDDLTCGPTSLHAVYNYYNDIISLDTVIKEVAYLEEGGTLGVLLGSHALKRGYRAMIYTYNLKVIDPTWFSMDSAVLIEKLKMQLHYKKGKKFHRVTDAYIEFLELGGVLNFTNLSPSLLRKYFRKNIPILAGLSATYLYTCARESTDVHNKSFYDDIKGHPVGHFVILCGFDILKRHVVIADPYKENPLYGNNYYSVRVDRLLNS